LNFEKKNSEPLHTKMNPTSCLFGSRFVWTQTMIFSAEPCFKNAGRIPTSHNPNQNSAALWRIFSANKSTPPNRKKGFYTKRDQNKQEVGFIFV
jgi:hypothetical protein